MPDASPAEAAPRIKIRIESLSDLVFGLALSLGAIALIQNLPQDSGHLTNDVVLFAFSFLIIVGTWLGYTRIVSVLQVETPGALYLNLALLFCIALEPFLYYVFESADATFLNFSSAAFGLDIGSMWVLLAAMVFLLLRQEANSKVPTLSPGLVRRFKISMVTQGIGGAVFAVSTLDVFWVQVPGYGFLRFLIWYFALAVVFSTRWAARVSSWREEKSITHQPPPHEP
ncbi:MAG: TMEM175 family protein [Thaumarchaeota archaeon]|nr:TMEM175 family protein [Nitrososphaerota archaeon]